MNASSESGECASLISTGSVSVFWVACLPAMSFFKFLGILRLACKETFPFRWGRSEREEEDVRDAGTCEAPCRVYFALKSLTHPARPIQIRLVAQAVPGGVVCRRLTTPSLRRFGHCCPAKPRRASPFPRFPSSQICPEAYNSPNEV